MNIPHFSIKELPEELENIDRKFKVIPPILQKQFNFLPFKLGRINVSGDGYCGYYVLQLLVYINNYKILSLTDIDKIRVNILQEIKMPEDIIFAKRHYLEYLEFGIILNKLVPNINIGIIVQTNLKKTGEPVKRVYPCRVLSYTPEKNWVFILLSNNGYHYELLTIQGNNGLHYGLVKESDAKKIFYYCNSEYPEKKVNPLDQVGFLSADDFYYF